MHIQWFPGHMHKARKEILKILSGIDVIIELLDARIPFSSQNPMLAEIRGDKPCLRLLHKSDLADETGIDAWIASMASTSDTRVLPSSTADNTWVKSVPELCRQLTPVLRSTRAVHVLVTGIPNVGKSTVINLLAGRAIARTGNEPAITRAQQRIDIGKGVVLRDTPGVLWPNLENRNSGYRLALTGAIRDTAIDSADVAVFATEYLVNHYPERLQQRYNIDLPANSGSGPRQSADTDAVPVLEQIGRSRGAISRGGQIDFDRAGKLLINDFRSGALGRITLETPALMQAELAQLALLRQQREQRKKNRKNSSDGKKRD